MNPAVKPKLMKPLLGAAGVLGLVLRAVLYTAGTDRKGLLIRGYWAGTGIWALTAAMVLVLYLWCHRLAGSKYYRKTFPASFFSAAGAILAALSFILSPVAQVPSPVFGKIEPVLRFAAAAALLWISFCRFRGSTPFFLLHCTVCMYLALRLVCQYRIWSADPQIQNYAFYLGAHVALMITAYQLAAFDAGFGNHSRLWFFGLAGIYLSMISLIGSSEPFFLVCCIIWIWSSLCPTSLRKHRGSVNHQCEQEDQP